MERHWYHTRLWILFRSCTLLQATILWIDPHLYSTTVHREAQLFLTLFLHIVFGVVIACSLQDSFVDEL